MVLVYHTINARFNLAKNVTHEDLLTFLVEVVFSRLLSPRQPKPAYVNNGSLPK